MDRVIQRLAYPFSQERVSKLCRTAGSIKFNEYMLKRIDRMVVARSQEFTEEYYREYWGSFDHFDQHGFGYAIMHQDKIVCECTSIFCNPEQAEMDIVTSEEYRGQGWGLECAQAFIEVTLRRKAVPRWDCYADNTASRKMASRLGFAESMEYTVYVRK
ncbi:MAG TPA: GNAT family N-acetyltransferase [Candidatus Bathyarchaeia archaeon]|nr:GNAT family N-acetyltransferase [Candidatus Bathyarchaeia archaeon]